MKIFSKKTKPLMVSLIILVGVFGVSLGVLAQSSLFGSGFVNSTGFQTKHGRLVVTNEEFNDPSDMDPSNSIDEPWLADLRLFVERELSSFAVLDSAGDVHVTPASSSQLSYATFGSSSIDTSSTVAVVGGVLATDFTTDGNPATLNKLCSSQDGVIQFCTSQPSPGMCGDNSLDIGEECDDGNTLDGDTCSATCESTISIFSVSSLYCNASGQLPYGPSKLYSHIQTNDYSNSQEVSTPTTDPDYNSTFIEDWEWEEAQNLTVEWLANTTASKDPSDHSMTPPSSTGIYVGLDGAYDFSDIENAMSSYRTFSASSVSQYEDSVVQQSFTGSSSYELPEGIYRVRSLDGSGDPFTGWKYVNTLVPAAMSYNSSYTYASETLVDGKDLLVNNTNTYGGIPQLAWTNALNDTTQMDFFTYVLQRRPQNGSWTTLLTADASNPLKSYTDSDWSGLSSGTYEYRVFVQNSCGGSVAIDPSTTLSGQTFDFSNTVSATRL